MTTKPVLYTHADAITRVLSARLGSLDPERVSYQYLVALRQELLLFLDSVERQFAYVECDHVNEEEP
jgi:hypothetical protein